jgi:hypothetical protein
MEHSAAMEYNQEDSVDRVRVVNNLDLAAARDVMLRDLGRKPASARALRNAGIKNAPGQGEDVYLMRMPGRFFVAISVSEVRPATAVAVKIFDYDSNRISAIEHAQGTAVHYREIVTEVLRRSAVARHVRGSGYST